MEEKETQKAPDGASLTCACGHDVALHGRRGYGSCRYGRGGALAQAVAVVRAGVVSGASDQQIHEAVESVRDFRACACKRFRKWKPADYDPIAAPVPAGDWMGPHGAVTSGASAERSDAPEALPSRGTP